MKMNDFIAGFNETFENIEEGKSCPLCDICHDFLTPAQYFECVNGKNLCSKSEMSTKSMLNKIISEIECLNS